MTSLNYSRTLAGKAALGVIGFIMLGAMGSKSAVFEVTRFPETIDRACRDGRAKIYDECTDQREIYDAARSRARTEDKVLLVEYGAEWCIWCHVFSAYIDGHYDEFRHTYSSRDDKERYTETLYERAKRDVKSEAEALNAYVAENFVVVHIEYKYSAGGDEVLAASGADAQYDGGLPYIYTVKADGTFGGVFDHDRVENRRDTSDWFRGYHRPELLKMLTEMHAAAQ